MSAPATPSAPPPSKQEIQDAQAIKKQKEDALAAIHQETFATSQGLRGSAALMGNWLGATPFLAGAYTGGWGKTAAGTRPKPPSIFPTGPGYGTGSPPGDRSRNPNDVGIGQGRGPRGDRDVDTGTDPMQRPKGDRYLPDPGRRPINLDAPATQLDKVKAALLGRPEPVTRADAFAPQLARAEAQAAAAAKAPPSAADVARAELTGKPVPATHAEAVAATTKPAPTPATRQSFAQAATATLLGKPAAATAPAPAAAPAALAGPASLFQPATTGGSATTAKLAQQTTTGGAGATLLPFGGGSASLKQKNLTAAKAASIFAGR